MCRCSLQGTTGPLHSATGQKAAARSRASRFGAVETSTRGLCSLEESRRRVFGLFGFAGGACFESGTPETTCVFFLVGMEFDLVQMACDGALTGQTNGQAVHASSIAAGSVVLTLSDSSPVPPDNQSTRPSCQVAGRRSAGRGGGLPRWGGESRGGWALLDRRGGEQATEEWVKGKGMSNVLSDFPESVWGPRREPVSRARQGWPRLCTVARQKLGAKSS